MIEEEGGEAGLHNLWFVFLPPNVDECIEPGACGTNAFAGYHSLTNTGSEPAVYAVAIDPIIEIGAAASGGDPEGNPDAEITADVAGHETIESMTDPEGTGWVDPNGYEVADKCEFGPQHGTPLGFATDGSPYNQVINGHKYLLQEMWSNDDGGCVQGTNEIANQLPLLAGQPDSVQPARERPDRHRSQRRQSERRDRASGRGGLGHPGGRSNDDDRSRRQVGSDARPRGRGRPRPDRR